MDRWLAVALRKESVDRNALLTAPNRPSKRSLSARRAWIEIGPAFLYRTFALVALRKESVDRNLYYGDNLTFSDGSLSARRAWIEIFRKHRLYKIINSRSPQGERG